MNFIAYNGLTILILMNAAEGAAIKKIKNQFILSDYSCENAIKTVQYLKEWTQQTLKSTTACDLKKNHIIEDKKTGDCKIDITNCIPDHVLKYQGSTPENAGPNCWNLALVMKGILPNLRYTPPEEMAFYMNPPLCRQISNNEKKIPGDVGAIRLINPEGIEEYHGFIYISDDLAYSKNGYSKYSPYLLQPLNKVLKVYEVPDKKKCRSNEIDNQSDCKKATSFFRCISIDEYLTSHSEIPNEISNALTQVNMYEGCLEKQTFNRQIISTQVTQNLSTALEALTFYLKDELKNNKIAQEPNQTFLLGRIQLALYGIINQIVDNGTMDMNQEVYQFAKSFSQALRELKGENE